MSCQEKKTISLYLLFPLWQIILFTQAFGTKEYSLHSASIQIQANTALLNIAFNLDADYSVLEKLQFKGEQQKAC